MNDPAGRLQPQRQRIEGRAQVLGEGMPIVRALPTRGLRTVGAWCFLDHFGPSDVTQGPGMRVGPHPHIGLQTVTWLLEGEILHRDSLGSVQSIRPGQLNLMTSGRGISHSEESPAPRPSRLHGAQFWVALPEGARHGEPAFEHHAQLPCTEHQGLQVTVLLGEAFGLRSPGTVYSPLVGMDVRARGPITATLPLRREWEYGFLVLQGAAELDTEALAPRHPPLPWRRPNRGPAEDHRTGDGGADRRSALRRALAHVVELRRPLEGRAGGRELRVEP